MGCYIVGVKLCYVCYLTFVWPIGGASWVWWGSNYDSIFYEVVDFEMFFHSFCSLQGRKPHWFFCLWGHGEFLRHIFGLHSC